MLLQKFFLPYHFGFLGCLLILLGFGSEKNSVAQQPEYGSVTVYDTIYVYDTIWTYETVYDTIWVYDTIYINEIPEQQLHLLDPTNVLLFCNSPSELLLPISSPFSESCKQYQNIKQKKKTVSKKSSLYQSRYPDTSYSMLTLNPTKGVFDPGLFLMGTFSVEGYAGPTLQRTQYSFYSEDERNRDIENAVSDLTGWEYGVRLNYNIFQISFQTGIGLSQLREQIDYNTTEYYQDSILQTIKKEKLITVYDTIHILNLDEYLKGRVVYDPYIFQYDSLIYIDSSYYKKYTDSTLVETKENNSHYLLEIPLLFSYSWQLPQSAIQITVGGYNQFHLFSTGKAHSGYETVSETDKANTFTKYNFALYGSLGYVCNLTKKFRLGFYGYYKYPLREFSKTSYAVIHKQTYGVNFSVQYHF